MTNRPATYVEIALALLVLVLSGNALYDRTHKRNDTKLQILHSQTIVRETLLVVKKADAAQAITVYRTLRDTTLLHLTDTLLVKQTLARADTVILKDSLVIAAADSVIASQKRELAEALKPPPDKRLRYTVAALYDPVNATLSGSGGVALHVISGLALTARVEQSLAIGEKLSVRVGVAFSF